MQRISRSTIEWIPDTQPPVFHPEKIAQLVSKFRKNITVVQASTGHLGIGLEGKLNNSATGSGYSFLASLPPLYPEWLGDRNFLETHNVRFPYVTGAMANGIATTKMVIEMSRANMLGFFGAAGLSLDRITKSVDELIATLGHEAPWGCNLIHSPNEPAQEEAVTELYLQKGVRIISAAAFLGVTANLVRYATTGLSQDKHGNILRKNYIFAKISHPQIATQFLQPAPKHMLEALVSAGKLTPQEAHLAQFVPIAEDITVESDSGGHTDNRPLTALFPTIIQLRDSMVAKYGFRRPIRVGAAGGLGTPSALAAAFGMGAAYVLTGSVNQGCIESGLDVSGREMLASADIGDVIMAPAADMFEQGVKVQVLQRGTMFAARARKLYELYRKYPSLEAIPQQEAGVVEKQILKASFQDAWNSTRDFWTHRDVKEVHKAEQDSKHKMALVFRSYLGQASRWAINGVADRRVDFQIWCGPAMGSFNSWVKGSHLEKASNRRVVDVALNLLEGAAVITRGQQLRSYGVPISAKAFEYLPSPLI
jgi:trans-AT polyketide synthase, acyltransferase and oxidoreductase domains